MRIEYKQEGGFAHFPGLSQPVAIDSAQLSQVEAAELRRLVDEAHFFELPQKVDTPSRGAADYYQYTITIEDGARRHTVQFTELADNPPLKNLLAFLKSQRATQAK
jgi:emfourin